MPGGFNMKRQKEYRPLEGGPDDDLLLGTRRNDTINGYEGDDVIVGGRGRDVMSGGDGSDTFVFDDKDTGDVTFEKADAITDFGAEDFVDLIATNVLYFAGFGIAEPERGGLSLWQAEGNTYVTWKSFGVYQDIELTGYTGDLNVLLGQIRWYEDDYAGSVATVGAIAPGEAVQGNIETTVDRDWFRVEVEAGNLYEFDLQGEADGGGTLIDPYLVFYDEECNFVTDGYEELFFDAEADGTYFISAESFGFTGSYTLELDAGPYTDDFGGDTGTDGEIAPGEIVTGVVGLPFDYDWFRVDLEAGDLYTFTLLGEAAGGGTLREPLLELFDQDGNWVASNTDELFYYAESGGTYFISAGSFGGAGTYTLELAAEPYVDDFGGDTDTEGEIAPGETVTGVIGVPNDEDWLMIELEEGETYTIDLRGQSFDSGSLPDPYLRLHDAAGVELANNDDFDGLDSRIVYTAESDGTYFIAARELGAGTGDYQLSVSEPAAELLLV